ncbi:unnamed protein product [Alopecurus aequalis]
MSKPTPIRLPVPECLTCPHNRRDDRTEAPAHGESYVMSPRRQDRARKSVARMEARVAKATSGTSFSKPPPPAPLSSLPETARFFFEHLPRHSRGGPGVAADEAWERKTALRNSIHDAYLRALARLPFNGPPTMPSLLPALLAGGHCFGPLADGASNVIVNTVWMNAASSPARFAAAAVDTVLDVVDLHHIKMGSFLGLTRVPRLDDDDRGYDYYYAAIAARHPNCEAFAAFAPGAEPGFGHRRVRTCSEPRRGALLSHQDIERLSALLVPSRGDPPLDACLVPQSKLNAEREERVRSWQAWRRKFANMAIDHWSRTIGGPQLQLKAVCGISIGDPDYEHINFMAAPRDKPADVQLFFAEHERQTGIVLCCPVPDSVSRSGHAAIARVFMKGLSTHRLEHPFRTPLDATSDIIDFDIANLLDIKYARHLWGSRHMVSSGDSTRTYSSPEWVSEYDIIIIQ